jgi:uncharacterized OB-fold protein
VTAPSVPEPDEVTAPWWEATRRRELLLQSCPCGHRQHPPRAVCSACGRTDGLEWVRASGSGTVDACTVVHRAPAPGFEPPYVVARIRLAEGPVLLSNVTATDPDAVRIDDAVALDWRPLPDGRALPVFAPAYEES